MFNKRCIVTGGAGFIGSALVRHLVRILARDLERPASVGHDVRPRRELKNAREHGNCHCYPFHRCCLL